MYETSTSVASGRKRKVCCRRSHAAAFWHLERRPLDRDQPVDGNRLGVLWERRQLVDEPDAIPLALAQPDDAARAHTDPGVPHIGEGLEPVRVLAGGGHLVQREAPTGKGRNSGCVTGDRSDATEPPLTFP